MYKYVYIHICVCVCVCVCVFVFVCVYRGPNCGTSKGSQPRRCTRSRESSTSPLHMRPELSAGDSLIKPVC